MIKILKRGKFNPPHNKVTCDACRCEFTFQKTDARYDSGGGREEPSYIVKCPELECKKEIWIDATLVK